MHKGITAAVVTLLLVLGVACGPKSEKTVSDGKEAAGAVAQVSPGPPGPLHGPATEIEWLTDPAQARKLAAEKKRPILINFEGSDWCVWCLRLDDEVFSRKPFEEYARKNLVLLSVDFPRDKPQTAEVRRRNEQLAKEYGVEGFPTLVITDSAGKELGRTGYQPGGPTTLVNTVKKILAERGKLPEI